MKTAMQEYGLPILYVMEMILIVEFIAIPMVTILSTFAFAYAFKDDYDITYMKAFDLAISLITMLVN